jgi:hypothetical protein
VIDEKVKSKIDRLSKGSPPPAGSIKESFCFYEPDKKKARKMQALWETVLLWSGYSGYYNLTEIAKILHTTPNVVSKRIEKLKKLYPTAYEKIVRDRAAIGKATTRQIKSLANPDFYTPKMDKYIKERF